MSIIDKDLQVLNSKYKYVSVIFLWFSTLKKRRAVEVLNKVDFSD